MARFSPFNSAIHSVYGSLLIIGSRHQAVDASRMVNVPVPPCPVLFLFY